MTKNVYWSSCKVAVILVSFRWNLKIFDIFSKGTEISNFMKIRPAEGEMLHADRRTDMTKLIVAFRNFTNAPKRNILNRNINFYVVKQRGCATINDSVAFEVFSFELLCLVGYPWCWGGIESMNFGHATLPSSGAVTRLVPGLATASSHEDRVGAGVTGTTLIASSKLNDGSVVVREFLLS